MIVKTSAGAAVCIPQGTIKDIYCDGANGVFRADADQIGEIWYFGGTSAPPGSFLCDGSTKLRAMAIDLFGKIGTTWGAGNGATTFTLPDLYTAGRFMRAATASVAVGTLQAADIAAHNHTASALTTITSISIAADGAWMPNISISDPGHRHRPDQGNPGATFQTFVGGGGGNNQPAGANASQTGFTDTVTTGISATSTGIGNHSHGGSSAIASTSVTVNNSTGTETRPINASALACIRY
jgi:microcystin-dependent protein